MIKKIVVLLSTYHINTNNIQCNMIQLYFAGMRLLGNANSSVEGSL